MRRPRPRSTTTTPVSAARVVCAAIASARASYSYFSSPCRPSSQRLRDRAATRRWPPLPTAGCGARRRAALPGATWTASCPPAARPARTRPTPLAAALRGRAGTTASTRTSTARSPSRSRSRSAWTCRVATTRAASSCWWSSGRARSRAARRSVLGQGADAGLPEPAPAGGRPLRPLPRGRCATA